MQFNFNKLFPRDEETPFQFSSVKGLKDLNFYRTLKNEEDLLEKCKSLRTMANILKTEQVTIELLFWLRDGLDKKLSFLSDDDVKEYFKEVFNLLMFAKFDYDCNNKREQKITLGKRLCLIVIGKLSTIINLLTYDENLSYDMKTSDGSRIEQIERQVELFQKDKLDVNSIEFNVNK